MKKFSRSEIEGVRSHFEANNFPEIPVELDEYSFTYFDLPQSLEPNLPDFAFRCTGEPEDGYVLGVSNSVREEFRPYVTVHEYIEFTQIGIETDDRCVRALEKELELVPEQNKSEYVEMRRKFFGNLIDYCSNRPEQFTGHDIEEFQKSYQRLNDYV